MRAWRDAAPDLARTSSSAYATSLPALLRARQTGLWGATYTALSFARTAFFRGLQIWKLWSKRE
eukprot:4563950-Lingulodinium_polyedra.AAC.1